MSDDLKQIDKRINDLWAKGHFNGAYDIIVKELVPILKDSLAADGLSESDSEDVVGDILLGFSNKIDEEGPHSISTPKPYLWRAAENRKIDCGKKNTKLAIPESQISPSNLEIPLSPHEYLDNQFYDGKGNHLIPTWQKSAIYMVEG